MRTIIFSVIIGFLFSCCSNSKQQQEETRDDFKNFDTIISFSGSWLSEDYYNSIKAFNSPIKAQNGSQFIVIPERTLQQTIMIYNFHEGGEFLKILKHGNDYEIWDEDLTQQLYSIEIVSSTKIKLDNKTFVKINNSTHQDKHIILEEILFRGQYTNSEGQTVEFKNDRQVVGLDDFKFYRPEVDYYDAGMDIDQVGLGNSEKDLEWYGFKFNKDTLALYKLDCLDSIDNGCVEVGYGELTYKLWRKK